LDHRWMEGVMSEVGVIGLDLASMCSRFLGWMRWGGLCCASG